RQHRVEPCAVELISGQLDLADSRERSRHPAGFSVVRPRAVAPRRIFRKTQIGGALIRRLRVDLDLRLPPLAAELHAGSLRHEARERSDLLLPADRLSVL